MRQRLPLFPLGTVLYPGAVLPLHVFEERYRRLVRDLSRLPEGAARHFGVVAIREGHEVGAEGVRALYDVGCTAEIRQVREYADGRFDLVTVGARRFRLAGLDRSLPYLQGDVETLPEPLGSGTGVDALAVEVAHLYLAYRGALLAIHQGVRAPRPTVPDDPVVLSYLVAASLVVGLGAKQGLIATENAMRRLAAERDLLRQEIAVMAALPSLPAVDLLQIAARPN
ncbi:MAG: LON peptidase substrate-binding domain-containing protein [Carbonactinosporaceae bacterium]